MDFKGRRESAILATEVWAPQRQCTVKWSGAFRPCGQVGSACVDDVLIGVLGLLLLKSVFICALVKGLSMGREWTSVSVSAVIVRQTYWSCSLHTERQPGIPTALFRAQSSVSVRITFSLAHLTLNTVLTGFPGLPQTRFRDQPAG